MKLKLFYFFASFFILVCISCEKEETPKPQPEKGYPTTYEVLSQSEWSSVNDKFQEINIHDSLSLNEYGFVEGKLFYEPIDGRLEANFVVEKVDGTIERYRDFMGIDANSFISTADKLMGYDYSIMHGSTTEVFNYFEMVHVYEGFMIEFYDIKEQIRLHDLFVSQEKISSHPFNGPRIYFSFDELSHEISISGNWFSEVFVPAQEIYNDTEALEIAYKFIPKIRIEKDELIGNIQKENIRIDKRFHPIYLDESVELREFWILNIPLDRIEKDGLSLGYDYCKIFVDTQTGNVEQYFLRHYII